MMREIYLHGALGKEFGRKFQFDADSVVDVLCALRANFPRFANAIRNGFYKIIVGKRISTGMALAEHEISGFNLGAKPVHIVPVTAGRKNGGLGKIITGIALIGLSMVPGLNVGIWSAAGAGGATWSGAASALGTSMLLTGAATMIAPEIDSGDTKESFTMSGPSSNVQEGNIIPIAYGEVITGGYMISGGITINTDASGGGGDGNGIWSRITLDELLHGGAFREVTPGGSAPANP